MSRGSSRRVPDRRREGRVKSWVDVQFLGVGDLRPDHTSRETLFILTSYVPFRLGAKSTLSLLLHSVLVCT